MKSLRFAFAAFVLLLVMAVSPAVSAAESTAVCYGSWRLSFSPGVSLTSQKSTFTTHGDTGTMNCVGTFKGYEITGVAALGQEGIFEGTCLQGTASSVITETVPTSAGPMKRSHSTTMTIGPGFAVKFSDVYVGGISPFQFYPTEGNCLTAPVTEIVVVAQGVLKS